MYIGETNLQSNIKGLIEQRIKKQVESRVNSKLSRLLIKGFENRKYYLKFDVDKFALEITDELSSIIIESVKYKEPAGDKIKSSFKNVHERYYSEEKIITYVENLVSNFKF